MPVPVKRWFARQPEPVSAMPALPLSSDAPLLDGRIGSRRRRKRVRKLQSHRTPASATSGCIRGGRRRYSARTHAAGLAGLRIIFLPRHCDPSSARRRASLLLLKIRVSSPNSQSPPPRCGRPGLRPSRRCGISREARQRRFCSSAAASDRSAVGYQGRPIIDASIPSPDLHALPL